MRLRGAVADGSDAVRGARVTVDGSLRDYDVAGVMRVTVPVQVASR